MEKRDTVLEKTQKKFKIDKIIDWICAKLFWIFAQITYNDLPVWVILVDENRRILYINDKIQQDTWYTKWQLLWQSTRILHVNDEIFEEVWKLYEKILIWETAIFDRWIIAKNWNIIFMEIHWLRKKFLWKTIWFLWTYNNITKQLQKIKKIENSKEEITTENDFLTTILNETYFPIFIKKLIDWKFIYVKFNKLFSKFLWLNHNDILNKDVFWISQESLAKFYQQKDQELLDSFLNWWQTSQEYEFEIITKSLERKKVKISKKIIRYNWEIYIIWSLIDINDQKLLEESLLSTIQRLRDNTNLNNILSFEIDIENWFVIYWDKKVFQLFWVDRQLKDEFSLDKIDLSVLNEEKFNLISQIINSIEQLDNKNIDIINTEIEFKIDWNRNYWILTCKKLDNWRIFVSLLDISYIKKFEKARELSEKIWRHDIKNQTQIIQTICQNILNSISEWNINIERIKLLINEIFYISKKIFNIFEYNKKIAQMESWIFSPTNENIKIWDLLKKALYNTTNITNQKSIEIEIFYEWIGEDESWQELNILWEFELLETALTNIITNAIEASQTWEKIQIIISKLFFKNNSIERWIEIKIINNWSISDWMIKRIFEKYITFWKSWWTWLWLYSSNLIIKSHWWNINCESKEWKVEFTISFPIWIN